MERQKAEEFKNVEHLKTDYQKFTNGEDFVYHLKLPNGEVVNKVNPSVALYIHSLERRLNL